MGWIVLALTFIGGIGAFAFEKLADSEPTPARKSNYKYISNAFIVMLLVGSAIGVYDQIQSEKNTLERIQEGIDSITGGDGFVYLTFPSDRTKRVEINAKGNHTQHVLMMSIIAIGPDKEKSMYGATSYDEKFISPYAGGSLSKAPPYMPDDAPEQHYVALMALRNCEISQIVGTYRRDDGTYSTATFVFRRSERVVHPTAVYSHVDDDYPKELAERLNNPNAFKKWAAWEDSRSAR